MLNDTLFLEKTLRERAATGNEILRRSMQERGCGLTVHSRAADLRRRLAPEGLTVACTRLEGVNSVGKPDYEYDIVPLQQS